MRHSSPFARLMGEIDPNFKRNAEVRIDASTLLVTRFNPYKGTTLTRDLPITAEQWDAYQAGRHIQHALPHLSDDDREWILSGLPGGDFDALFGGDE
jgi:hypothetical protein